MCLCPLKFACMLMLIHIHRHTHTEMGLVSGKKQLTCILQQLSKITTEQKCISELFVRKDYLLLCNIGISCCHGNRFPTARDNAGRFRRFWQTGLFVFVKDKPRAAVEPWRWVKHKNACLYNAVFPPVGKRQFLGSHFHLVVRKDNECDEMFR